MNVQEVIQQKNRRQLARLITAIENREPDAIETIKEIFGMTGQAWVIGVTGPAGVGKSTLLDSMIAYFRKEGKTVGVIAIDPTSPFTGGAILADRIRMQLHSLDQDVFIRSMATRGHLGGLSSATSDVVDLLDAYGKQIIIIETVGVGQDEVDIVKIAHSVAVVLMPGMGDEIQTMKAGLMEIADIFVINKADRDGADRLQTEIEAVLNLLPSSQEWRPKVTRTVALKREGIDSFCELLKTHYETLKSSEKFQQRRFAAIQQRLFDAYQDIAFSRTFSTLSEHQFREIIEDIYNKKIDPYTAAEKFFSK
jgi:GTPase